MKKLLLLSLSLSSLTLAFSQPICNSGGNLMIFSNYDGGVLNIDIDVAIPNLKIGICAYEGTTINVTGTHAINVTAIAYVGFNGNNAHCGSVINTSIVAPFSPGSTNTITLYPPATLSNPNGNGSMICATTCSNTTYQGGCNTVDQVEAYFASRFPGSVLYAHHVQYGCWSGTRLLSAGGTCCPISTEIADANIENGISVFPNPASDLVQITSATLLQNATVRLLNVMGGLALEEKIVSGNSFTLDLSKLAEGLYFVEINNGGTILRKNVVKK